MTEELYLNYTFLFVQAYLVKRQNYLYNLR